MAVIRTGEADNFLARPAKGNVVFSRSRQRGGLGSRTLRGRRQSRAGRKPRPTVDHPATSGKCRARTRSSCGRGLCNSYVRRQKGDLDRKRRPKSGVDDQAASRIAPARDNHPCRMCGSRKGIRASNSFRTIRNRRIGGMLSGRMPRYPKNDRDLRARCGAVIDSSKCKMTWPICWAWTGWRAERSSKN